MKIFLAGMEANKVTARVLLDVPGFRHRMYSFYYTIGTSQYPDAWEFLIDSGGFTARAMGKPVSVQKYAAYLNEHKFKCAINLDTHNHAETMANQQVLDTTTQTLILPVYHWADYLCRRELLVDFCHEYPYVALGGIAERTSLDEADLVGYLNYVFSVTGTQTPVHALGITKMSILKQYPFYSADSSSWLATAR